MAVLAYPRMTGEVGVTDITKPYGHIERHGAEPNRGNAHDNSKSIQLAIESAQELGGGVGTVYYGAGPYYIASDINAPRGINHQGIGGGMSRIISGSQRRFNVTGNIPSVQDMHTIQGIGFDYVSVDYGVHPGPTPPTDVGRGAVISLCDFTNCDRAVYYGYHTYNTKIMGCNFRLNQRHIYYDFATVVSDAGAAMFVSDSVLSEASSEALYMNGSTGDGYHMYFTNIICDNSVRFLKTVNVTTDGIISIKNVSFELISDCFIENQGANVVVDGFMALSGTENYWVWQKSSGGYVMFKNGRGYWKQFGFCRIDGGQVIFDQGSSFMNGPMWGTGLDKFANASSTGGKVMSTRNAYQGRHGESVGTVTNGSPTNTNIVAAMPFDYNDRIWEFDVSCSAVGSTNTLRVQLADGVSSPFIDLPFPNVNGGARVRVTWNRGGTITGSAVFAPSTAGNSQYVTASTSDTTSLSAIKFLAFVTQGPSASTMTISNFCETLMGHKVIGF